MGTAPEQIRLLVVDDDREVGSAMLQVLTRRGVDARVVRN
jgi:ActR/RegA family two-component response regulator